MNEKILEMFTGITLILLGLVIFLGAGMFLLKMGFLSMIIIGLILLLAIISLVTGIMMWKDSREE